MTLAICSGEKGRSGARAKCFFPFRRVSLRGGEDSRVRMALKGKADIFKYLTRR
jgi:hypothetical protein